MPRLNALFYARDGVSQGLSANQAYRAMVGEAQRLTAETGQQWTGVRRSYFLQVYAGTRNSRGQIPEAMNAPKDIPGGGLDIVSRPATVPGGYLHAAVGFTRGIGSDTIDRGVFLFRSSELLTPEEIEELTRQRIEENATDEHGSFYRVTVEGVSFTGVQQLVRDTAH